MPKEQVYKLARKLNIESKDLIKKLSELGIEVKNHMSALEDGEVKLITEHYAKPEKTEQPKAEPKPQPIKQEVPQKQAPQAGAQQQNRHQPQTAQKSGTQPQKQTPQAGAQQQNRQRQQPQTAQNAAAQQQKQAPQRPQQAGSQQQNKQQQGKTQTPQKQQQKQSQQRQAPKKQSQQQQKEAQAKENEAIKAAAFEAQIEEPRVIKIAKNISIKDLAVHLAVSGTELIKTLMKKGKMVNLNQDIDFQEASELAENYNVLLEEQEEEDILREAFKEEDGDEEKDLTERPPVVVVMGHVDHGKTSLLDAIRKANVTQSEAGGITQHIGAYTVSIDGKPITFLDTPGHEAFTAMRMRGAQVTDIAVLVVAADDGVMPQTVEAINHARAANIEIIVAINKIDKPSANPDRVKQELTEYNLLVEDWGGSTICVPVSAMKGEGIDNLLEMIILVSEMKELKANPNKRARGTVVEALLDKGRGPVATVLVQNGTLNVGEPIVVGSTYGKVRAMIDDKGKKLKKAGPSIPVEIQGLSEVPQAGDLFYVATSERHARQVAESVVAKSREDMIKDTPKKVSLDDLFSQIQLGNVKDLNVIVKADVQGSVEALRQSLEKLSNEEVRIRVIHGGVGAVTESDVTLASASNAIIIGFNVRPEPAAKSVADDQKVDVRLYRIIYNAIEDITAAMKGMLDPIYQEKVIGHAEIRQLFKASGVGTIAGSYVTDGKFTRSAKVRVVRGGIVVYDGTLDTLKRFKDDVKEVNSGYECGLLLHKYNDIKEGDIVEAYLMEEIPR